MRNKVSSAQPSRRKPVRVGTAATRGGSVHALTPGFSIPGAAARSATSRTTLHPRARCRIIKFKGARTKWHKHGQKKTAGPPDRARPD